MPNPKVNRPLSKNGLSESRIRGAMLHVIPTVSTSSSCHFLIFHFPLHVMYLVGMDGDEK